MNTLAPLTITKVTVAKHHGPGPHPGTGTPQSVHGDASGKQEVIDADAFNAAFAADMATIDPYTLGEVRFNERSIDEGYPEQFVMQWVKHDGTINTLGGELDRLKRLFQVEGFKATLAVSVYETTKPPSAMIIATYRNRDGTIPGNWTIDFERMPSGEIVVKPQAPIFYTSDPIGPEAEKTLIDNLDVMHDWKFGWMTEKEYQDAVTAPDLAAKIDLYPQRLPAYSEREAKLGYKNMDMWDGMYPGTREEIKAAGENVLIQDTDWPGAGTFQNAWASTSDDQGGPQDRLQLEAYNRANGTIDDYMTTTGMNVARAAPTRMNAAQYAWNLTSPLSLPDDPQGAASKAFDSIYSRTQKFLAEQGLGPDDEIVLYRGMALDPIEAGLGDEVTMRPRPLSSFSVSADIALTFAQNQRLDGQYGYVFGVRVPVKAIFSHWSTGFGCASEHEMVVLGQYLKGLPLEVVERLDDN